MLSAETFTQHAKHLQDLLALLGVSPFAWFFSSFLVIEEECYEFSSYVLNFYVP